MIATRVDGAKYRWPREDDLIIAYLVLTERSDPRRGVDFLRKRGSILRTSAMVCCQVVYGPWLQNKPLYRLALGPEVLEFVRERMESIDSEESRWATRLITRWEGSESPGR